VQQQNRREREKQKRKKCDWPYLKSSKSGTTFNVKKRRWLHEMTVGGLASSMAPAAVWGLAKVFSAISPGVAGGCRARAVFHDFSHPASMPFALCLNFGGRDETLACMASLSQK
jgi:hypothetical protein